MKAVKSLLTRYGASKYIAGDDHETGRPGPRESK